MEALEREARDNAEVTAELRKETRGLLDELKSLNSRHEELLAERESDQTQLRAADEQIEMFKKKYEQAKTELRNMKGSSLPIFSRLVSSADQGFLATSQLFVQSPKQMGDFMPASPSGAIADIYMTKFQAAIDSLLTAGRSNAPASVLSAMKALVLAVSKIDEDVQTFERDRINELDDVEQDRLHVLKRNCNGTLNNLMTAAKNHATSSGLSPVSLLDAAASHLTVTVIDISKMLKIRPATAQEREQSSRYSSTASASRSPSTRTPTNGVSSPVGNPRLGSLKKEGSIGSTSSFRDRFSPVSESGGRPRPQHGPDRSLDTQSSFSAGRRGGTPDYFDSGDTYGSKRSDNRGHYGRPSGGSSTYRYSNREDEPEPNGRRYSSSPDRESESRRRYASSVGSVDHEVFDSPPGGKLGEDVSLEQGKSDEESWEELKVTSFEPSLDRNDIRLIVVHFLFLPGILGEPD
jgi:hypothetical protein